MVTPSPGTDRASESAWGELLTTTEGRIFVLGLALATAGLIALGAIWLISPESSGALWAMAAANILFGYAAGLSVGYATGFGHNLVIPVNMLIETVLVLLFYPLFVFGWERLVRIRTIGRLIVRTRKAAEKHQETVRKYGLIGLMAFVWIPFWMTGPVVGCAIGYLLGFRPWVTLAAVLGGIYLGIACWSLLLREFTDRLAVHGPIGPALLVLAIILIAVGGRYLHGGRRRRKRKSNH